MSRRIDVWAAGVALLLAAVAVAAARPQDPAAAAVDEAVILFDRVSVAFDANQQQPVRRGDLVVRGQGQVVERTIRLPAMPADRRDTRRITAEILLQPVLVGEGANRRPGDRLTRLGSLSVVVPGGDGDGPAEVELVRLTTGFGGRGSFTQDLTALAPLLAGERTLRIFLSTYQSPGWEVSVALRYAVEGAGQRRPVFARPLFNGEITAESPRVRAAIQIPPRLDQPRIRILTTGHASDGRGGNEFVTCTHVLRVDTVEVARWRPWNEEGGALRDLNPTSGRREIDGRVLWSSDFDRAGWHPGTAVQPLVIPLPELSPGNHVIELEILGIRPMEGHPPARGYWRTSAIVVADERWPVGR